MGRVLPHRPSVRLLQMIRGGSYTITLPSWWVERQGLKRGSRLLVTEDGSSLRVAPIDSAKRRSSIELSLDQIRGSRVLRYCVWTYYMQGADEIIIKSSESLPLSKKRLIRSLRLDLPGIDIVREDSHTAVLAAVPEDTEKLDDVITAIHEMALTVLRDAVKSLLTGNVELAEEVTGREGEFLRRYRRLIRQLSLCSQRPELAYKSGVESSRELIIYVMLARDLNRSVYHGIYIARHFLRLGRASRHPDILRMLESLAEKAYRMQKIAMESFIERNFQKVLEAASSMDEIKSYEEAITKRVLNTVEDMEEAVVLLLILRELRRIAGYSVAIADAAANKMLAPPEAG